MPAASDAADAPCNPAQPRGASAAAPREAKAAKHILTAYNRDNQMLLRRKKVRRAAATAQAVHA